MRKKHFLQDRLPSPTPVTIKPIIKPYSTEGGQQRAWGIHGEFNDITNINQKGEANFFSGIKMNPPLLAQFRVFLWAEVNYSAERIIFSFLTTLVEATNRIIVCF